jgi:fumarate reductase subunit D
MKILGPATVFGPIILIILTILMGLVFASPPTSSNAISMTVNEPILVFIFVVIGAALFAARRYGLLARADEVIE